MAYHPPIPTAHETHRYRAALGRVERSKEFWEKHAEKGRGGWRSLPAHLSAKDPAGNEDRSVVEVYEFKYKSKPRDRYFAYWSRDGKTINSWMGKRLARITWSGFPYRDNFGGERINFQAVGINGLLWSGTYFKSAGDYVRMRALRQA